ncbi:aminotransferase class V-fold PLP-dependent enzyme [Algihabitans albus]|uniref:aminotransferase class V-fold PLP-dependent enzyme n=1 Tax=Algihabitans albus TaxID=2164067 RepID=UPI001F3DBE29|nr:aminotransferase class V-fold PLP-dependent enzyme [Algihabitans albus]
MSPTSTASVMESIDLARVRAETPGCAKVAHFNNAGAALMPTPVVEAQIAHLRREAEIGGYEARAEAAERLDSVYGSIGRLLNCGAEEIALVENATVAWNLAFQAFDWQPGDKVLTAEAEYASNYIAYLHARQRRGIEVVAVPSDASGQVDLEELERRIDPKVKLIAITHVPTNGGLVNPAAAVGRIARAKGIPFLLDACQSTGQLDIDVEAIGCDLLSATGRKYLRAPRGTGFLYVRRSLLERLDPPFPDLRSARWEAPDRFVWYDGARRFENWEFNYAAVLGLGAAVDYALDLGLPAIEARVTALAAELRERLGAVSGIEVTDLGETRCGLCTFTIAGREASDVAAKLRNQAINLSVSDPNGTLLDATRRGLPDLVRASVHYYNDAEEMDRLIAALAAL